MVVAIAKSLDRTDRCLRWFNKCIDIGAMEEREIVDNSQILRALHHRESIDWQVDVPCICHPVDMCVTANPTRLFLIDKATRSQGDVTCFAWLQIKCLFPDFMLETRSRMTDVGPGGTSISNVPSA